MISAEHQVPVRPAAEGILPIASRSDRSLFLARKMPQPYEFDPGHADGIRHADLDAGERVLNEIIYECQQSLEGIEHAKLDLDARSWARGQGLRE